MFADWLKRDCGKSPEIENQVFNKTPDFIRQKPNLRNKQKVKLRFFRVCRLSGDLRRLLFCLSKSNRWRNFLRRSLKSRHGKIRFSLILTNLAAVENQSSQIERRLLAQIFMPKLIEGEDFYRENGWTVLTETFHLKRGHCCQSECRHCPWGYTHDAARKEQAKKLTKENQEKNYVDSYGGVGKRGS